MSACSKIAGNGNNDDGWADVSRKKKNQNKRKIPEQHNPYIEAVNPFSNGGNDSKAQQQLQPYEPFMVLLVGLPGSGKSTFAQSLVASMPNKFCRINQDQLKSRKKCESRLKQVLSISTTSPSSQRLCPIIDRCNFDAQQRSTWYRLAENAVGQGSLLVPAVSKIIGDEDAGTTNHQGKQRSTEQALAALPVPSTTGIPVDVVVFDLPYEECLRRCEMRKGHETIKSPKQAAGILKQLERQWSPPHHRKNRGEKSRYRSLTVVRTDQDRKECLLQILKQMR